MMVLWRLRGLSMVVVRTVAVLIGLQTCDGGMDFRRWAKGALFGCITLSNGSSVRKLARRGGLTDR